MVIHGVSLEDLEKITSAELVSVINKRIKHRVEKLGYHLYLQVSENAEYVSVAVALRNPNHSDNADSYAGLTTYLYCKKDADIIEDSITREQLKMLNVILGIEN
jgi:hypothetical protein